MISPAQQWCHQIVVTNVCNRKCANCTQLIAHQHETHFMPPAEFEKCCIAAKGFALQPVPRQTPQPAANKRRPPVASKTQIHAIRHVHPGIRRPTPAKRNLLQPAKQPPTKEQPDQLAARRKIIGIFGGEPLLHPQFPELVDILIRHMPDTSHRGLWTGLDWKCGSHPVYGPFRPHVERLLGGDPNNNPAQNVRTGFLNWNQHTGVVVHQPILVASGELVQNEQERWRLIEACWLQREWSSAYTLINGELRFFFCEVAAAMARTLGWDGGLPIGNAWQEPLTFETLNGCRKPIGVFAKQVEWACQRCSVCLPLAGRQDSNDCDDISAGNIAEFRTAGSPRISKGDYVPCSIDNYYANNFYKNWQPNKYRLDAAPGKG